MAAERAPRLGPVENPSAVKYGLLSLLLRDGPNYAKELHRQFLARVGERWRPSSQSVYDALESLEVAGQVHVVPGTRGQTRVFYKITEMGREQRARWMQAPLSAPPFREEFWLKVVFALPEELPMLIADSYALERKYVAEIPDGAMLGNAQALARSGAPMEAVLPVMMQDAHIEYVDAKIRALHSARATLKILLERERRAGRVP